jgi:hypothetical protein
MDGKMRNSLQTDPNEMSLENKAQMPTDLGLFPGTFVQAPWTSYLKFMRSDFKTWLRIQWMLFKKPFFNTFGYASSSASSCSPQIQH